MAAEKLPWMLGMMLTGPSVYCCIPLRLPLAYVSQAKILVASVTTNIRVNRITKWQEWANTGKYTRGGRITTQGRCGRGQSMELLSVPSILNLIKSQIQGQVYMVMIL
jgi:hypothetical protein